ncbi:MAG: MBL fold metallo-hydrolase [Solirubrobacteraceae bacterium]|nr:MBL fold metallo-hydrolase [Patulibacter sp.]
MSGVPTSVPTSTALGTTMHGVPARYRTGFQDVGDDTWAWEQPNGDFGESNAGLIVSGDQALLVDTLWDLRMTRRMLDAAVALTGGTLPQTVVNTHSDGDHFWGNQLLPDAEIISTAIARKKMPHDTPAELARMARASRLLVAVGWLPIPVVGLLHIPGLPQLPSRRMGSMMRPFHFDEVEMVLPSRTFEGRLSLKVGDRDVEVIEVGPAHTAGDAIVWVPDVAVCFAADVLFVDTTPMMWAGPVASFARAVDQVLALDAVTFVPGHGPVCGRAEVELVRDYVAWVQEEAVPRVASGESATKAARSLLLSSEFASLPWSRWDNPASLVLTLHTEQYVLAGGRGHLPPRLRARAMVQMQMTAAALDRARRKRT